MEPDTHSKIQFLRQAITVEVDFFLFNPTLIVLEGTTYLLFLRNIIVECPAIKTYPNLLSIINPLFIRIAQLIPLLARAIGRDVRSMIINKLVALFDILLHTAEEKDYFKQIMTSHIGKGELALDLKILIASITYEYDVPSQITRIAEKSCFTFIQHLRSKPKMSKLSVSLLKLAQRILMVHNFMIANIISWQTESFLNIQHTKNMVGKLTELSVKYPPNIPEITRDINRHYGELQQLLDITTLIDIIRYPEEKGRQLLVAQHLSGVPWIEQHIKANSAACDLVVKLLFWFLMRKRDKDDLVSFASSSESIKLIRHGIKMTNRLVNLSELTEAMVNLTERATKEKDCVSGEEIMRLIVTIGDRETRQWFMGKVQDINARPIVVSGHTTTDDFMREVRSNLFGEPSA